MQASSLIRYCEPIVYNLICRLQCTRTVRMFPLVNEYAMSYSFHQFNTLLCMLPALLLPVLRVPVLSCTVTHVQRLCPQTLAQHLFAMCKPVVKVTTVSTTTKKLGNSASSGKKVGESSVSGSSKQNLSSKNGEKDRPSARALTIQTNSGSRKEASNSSIVPKGENNKAKSAADEAWEISDDEPQVTGTKKKSVAGVAWEISDDEPSEKASKKKKSAAVVDEEPRTKAGKKRSAADIAWEMSDDDEEGVGEASRLRILTWNIDMDTEFTMIRTRALISEIRTARPDIVMLQEVTDTGDSSVLAALQRALCTPPTEEEDADEVLSYNMYTPHRTDMYFCLLLARRGVFSADVESTARAFRNSMMGRGIISLRGTLADDGPMIHAFTAHLESLKMGTAARKQQFTSILADMREEADDGVTTLFGGDTNLRENEILASEVAKTVTEEAKRDSGTATGRKRAKKVAKIGDAWVMAGANDKEKFTWDTLRNDNLKIDSQFKPRTRYDRLFLFGPKDGFPQVVSYRLLGTKRLESCGVFISDHFGVLVDVDIFK